MIQGIRKYIDRIKKTLISSNKRKCCSLGKVSDSKGQIAIILILMTAVALIFYAITLNLGRLSTAKTMSSIAAEKSASVLASQMASYCQKLVKENLKGKLKVCDKTSMLTAIITFIIIIIIVVIAIILAPFTSGGSLYVGGKLNVWLVVMLVAAVVLSMAAVVMQAAVVQPGITAMWNKIIGETMSMKNQFVESGVRTGLEAAVSDSGEVADVFDMDTDGVWGFDAADEPRDMVSRFGFYYTERLRTIQKPDDSEVMAFIRSLDDFMHGDCLYYTVDCHAVVPAEGRTGDVDEAWGLSDPLFVAGICTPLGSPPGAPEPACTDSPTLSESNICCVPDNVRETVSGLAVELRPACCDTGVGECNESVSCGVPGSAVSPYSFVNTTTGFPYKWVLDPFVENNYNNAPDAPNSNLCSTTLPLPSCCSDGNPDDCCGDDYCMKIDVGVGDEVWEDHPRNDEGSAGDDGTDNVFFCPEDCYKSLREEIGKDDEHRLYQKNPLQRSDIVQVDYPLNDFLPEDTTGFYNGDPVQDDGRVGVYPVFWRMIDWGWDLKWAFNPPALPMPQSLGIDYCYWDSSAACVAAGILDHAELQANRLGVLPVVPATLTYDQTDHVNATIHNSLVFGDPPLASDRISIPSNIIALTPECAQEAFLDANIPPDGIDDPNLGFWKKGSDRFCSRGDVGVDTEEWPYSAGCPKSNSEACVCDCWIVDDTGSLVACTDDDDGNGSNLTYQCPCCSEPCEEMDPDGILIPCTQDIDGDGNVATVPADCACGEDGSVFPAATNPALALDETHWPEDVLEDFAYGITEFLQSGTSILQKPGNDMVNNFDYWYEELVRWIEPYNDGTAAGADRTTDPLCYNCEGTAAKPFEGILWQWMKDLGEIGSRLRTFLESPYVAVGGFNLCGNAWCVPNTGACPTFAAAHEEHDKEAYTFDTNSNGIIGDMEDVAACIDYNVHDKRDIYRTEIGACVDPGPPPGPFDGLLFDEDCDGVQKEYVFAYVAAGNAEKFLGCITHCNHPNCEFLPRSLVPGFDATAFTSSDLALYDTIDACLDTYNTSVPPGPSPMSVADCQMACGGGLFPGGTDPFSLNLAPYNVPPYVDPTITWTAVCNSACSSWCVAGFPDPDSFRVAVADQAVNHASAVERAKYQNCLDSVIGLAEANVLSCRAICDPATILHGPLAGAGWTGTWDIPPDSPTVVAPGSCAYWGSGVMDAFRQSLKDAVQSAGGSCSEDPLVVGSFTNLLQQSYMEAQNQVAKFDVRLKFLNNRVSELKKAVDVFEKAESKFNDFLEGPAQDIIEYRINFEDGTDNGLPSAAIYFWQSPPNDPSDVVGTGAWHAVRVDVRTPGRCSGRCNPSQDGPQLWPSIKTETHNWGTKRCFFIINYVGTVKSRVSRVDEDQSFVGGAVFPNGVPIWDFRFNHPLRPQTVDYDFAALGKTCAPLPGGVFVCNNGICESDAEIADEPPVFPLGCGWQDCNPVPLCGNGTCDSGENGFNCFDCGLSSNCCGDLMVVNSQAYDTVASTMVDIVPAAYIATFPDISSGAIPVRKIYSGALMLNKPISDGGPLDNSRCWLNVNSLLTRGVSSEACARYFWEGGGFTHRFVNCEDW